MKTVLDTQEEKIEDPIQALTKDVEEKKDDQMKDTVGPGLTNMKAEETATGTIEIETFEEIDLHLEEHHKTEVTKRSINAVTSATTIGSIKKIVLMTYAK